MSFEKRVASSNNVEWYTPRPYLDAARRVLGQIDLDPASCAAAQRAVKAKTYFTIADNGLAQQWVGRVWLNPPYSRGVIADFVEKLVEEFEWGCVNSAILLTHNHADTKWFHMALRASNAICFTRGRIRFNHPSGKTGIPTNGQTFFYFGPNPRVFCAVFDAIGCSLDTTKGVRQ